MNASFPVTRVLAHIEKAVQPYPKAMLFELRDRGYRDPFSILVACLVSIRTLDEVSLGAALLAPATFRHHKAHQLRRIAEIATDQYAGTLPCEEAALLELRGVGPKCAHLTLGIACGQPWIGVDIHVHRVTNRWGYVAAPTPEKTERALRAVLPKKFWVKINELLVPFGKHVCTGTRPHCSTCPVREHCEQVGVKNPR